MRMRLGLLLLLSSLGLPVLHGQQRRPPSTTYDHGIVTLRDGAAFFDLDDHAIRERRRVLSRREAEVGLRDGALFPFVPLRPVPGGALPGRDHPGISWSELTTSERRRAWIRVLRRRAPLTLEFIVEHGRRREGPPPTGARHAYALGQMDGVHLRVAPVDGAERIELEGLDEESGLFVPLGVFEEGRAVDRRPDAGSLRTYRIRSYLSEGRRAPDRILRGGPASRGFVEGSRLIAPSSEGSGLAFLTGEEVRREPDLVLEATFGGNAAAAFRDWTGGRVAAAPEDGRFDPWRADQDERATRIPPGVAFDVPLRGGGLARCRWTVEGRGQVRLHYRASLEETRLAPEAQLVVEVEGEDLRVRLEGRADLIIAEAVAEDLASPLGSRRGLDPDATRRVWTLPAVAAEACLELRARIEDREGRRHPALVRRFDRRPESVRRGRFRLQSGGLGFAFASASMREAEASDLVLTSFRGHPRSYRGTLQGEARLLTIERLVQVLGDASLAPLTRRTEAPPLESIRLFAPRIARHFGEVAAFDSRRWSRHFFAIRTRDGGWALTRILRAAPAPGGAAGGRLEAEYIYNPRRPVFGDFVVPLGEDETLRFVEE